MDEVETWDAIDRISDIPCFILHQILSLLHRNCAARTCVLSKHWNSVWNSFPVIHFNSASGDDALDAVDDDFRRLIRKNLRVQTLHVVADSLYTVTPHNFVSKLNQWITLALSNDAQEISLSLLGMSYCLPETSFVPKSVASGGFSFYPSFSFLKNLSLEGVDMSERVVRDIVRNCPNLEVLELTLVKGLRDIEIKNLEKLEAFKVVGETSELRRVDIDAPSLKKLNIFVHPFVSPSLVAVSLTSCHGLKHLCLSGCIVGDSWLQSHLPRFPLLQKLELQDSGGVKRFRVSAARLKEFHLRDCKNTEVVEIDAPNLSSFALTGHSCPILLSRNVTCHMFLALFCPANPHLNTSWFLNIRRNLGVSTEQSKILSLHLFHYEDLTSRYCFDHQELEDLVEEVVPPPVNVGDLIYFRARQQTVECERLVDGLLWSCHPKKITINFWDCTKDLCKKFLKEEDPTCCGTSHVKCWRHELKSAKVESFKEISEGPKLDIFRAMEADARLRYLSQFIDTITPQEIHHITFKLEWNC